MLNIRKQIVTDEGHRPIAVQIDYDDWRRIEKLLETIEPGDGNSNVDAVIGTLRWGEDAVAYQRRVREEWGR